jgi:hypothetical protein
MSDFDEYIMSRNKLHRYMINGGAFLNMPIGTSKNRYRYDKCEMVSHHV